MQDTQTNPAGAASAALQVPNQRARSRSSRLDGWTLGILALAAVFFSPMLAVLGIALDNSGDAWTHLASTVLGTYIGQTLLLIAGVGAGVLVIGVSTAWLVTLFEFRGRRVLQWALLLPLAMPSYIVAYAYTDLLEFAGPVQTALRQLFGWHRPGDYWFPEIRSLGGAATFMSLVLYPYVYLLARAAFVEQSQNLWDAARGLGHDTWGCFVRVGLPLARPAIAVGVLLALMETLNDFGTVDYFAVQTLTVGVYRVWFGMNNTPAAAQLASMVLVLVLVMAALEHIARGRRRFQFSQSAPRRDPIACLHGARAMLAFLACATPVALGFLVPAVLLGASAIGSEEAAVGVSTLGLAFNSIAVAGVAALVCLCGGLFLAYGARLSGTGFVRTATRLASIGYAVPGVVLAVGVLIPAAALDNLIDGVMRQYFGTATGLIFSGTLYALVFACTVRFLALSFGSVEAGLTKITPNMDAAARSLGHRPAGLLARIHFPLLRGSLMTGAMLVFVDAMKELPMTLILRPFNFNTLATHVYEYASYEAFEQAALPALAIVAAGLAPVITLSLGFAGSRRSSQASEPAS
ncbi:MAG: iron ABC transporter permease [Deltaproteobacteria bacterium]|nr:iron ABC transporter permease [Deltaproteobacteria bacterium]